MKLTKAQHQALLVERTLGGYKWKSLFEKETFLRGPCDSCETLMVFGEKVFGVQEPSHRTPDHYRSHFTDRIMKCRCGANRALWSQEHCKFFGACERCLEFPQPSMARLEINGQPKTEFKRLICPCGMTEVKRAHPKIRIGTI